MRMLLKISQYGIFPLLFVLWSSLAAYAAETDQYLAWGVQLKDSSEAFNRYLNNQAEEFLRKKNHHAQRDYTPEKLTQELYFRLFHGLYSARVRTWTNRSNEIDRFPDKSVSRFRYQQMSIYRDLSFPYVLPMARTIRLGDVYLGVDKISHFFGFGRRYFKRYLRHRERGIPEDEAIEEVIRWGIVFERHFVGGLVDGIVSHADLEAAFQGFRMAKDLSGGENPAIVHDGNRWVLARPIDIRPYITPDFDESYNNSVCWGARRRHVLTRLKAQYAAKRSLPEVQERFARYRQAAPSLSKKVITKYLDEKKMRPQQEQSVDALCAARE